MATPCRADAVIYVWQVPKDHYTTLKAIHTYIHTYVRTYVSASDDVMQLSPTAITQPSEGREACRPSVPSSPGLAGEAQEMSPSVAISIDRNIEKSRCDGVSSSFLLSMATRPIIY